MTPWQPGVLHIQWWRSLVWLVAMGMVEGPPPLPRQTPHESKHMDLDQQQENLSTSPSTTNPGVDWMIGPDRNGNLRPYAPLPVWPARERGMARFTKRLRRAAEVAFSVGMLSFGVVMCVVTGLVVYWLIRITL